MKRRVTKKLSKKLFNLIKTKQTFNNVIKSVWINDDECGDEMPYGTPCIGGEFDSYSGDASEIFTVYEYLRSYCEFSFPDNDWNPESGDWPIHKRKITGLRVIKLIKATP
jgi:hypothetical protein